MTDEKLTNGDLLESLAQMVKAKMDPAVLGMSAAKFAEAMKHVGSSAPRVTDADGKPLLRWQDTLIEEQIPEGASVLDLGCGEGELLARLIEEKHVRGQGVELNCERVIRCVERGVMVFQANIDDGLKAFPDASFDYVVLEETLQTLHRPADVLDEMLRVGKHGIVSFPNFAYWRVRLDLAIRGRMPVTEWLPHQWYNTPNIHCLTLQDFLDWAAQHNVFVLEAYVLCEGAVRTLRDGDNLYADEALLVVQKMNA